MKDNSFLVEPGEVFGLLGPNGAGKSTTLNMIIAEEGPTKGTVSPSNSKTLCLQFYTQVPPSSVMKMINEGHLLGMFG